MRNNQVKKLVILAFITALSVVLGNFLKIPTPTGFLTLLDAGIYFTAFYFGRKEAAIVGSLSSVDDFQSDLPRTSGVLCWL